MLIMLNMVCVLLYFIYFQIKIIRMKKIYDTVPFHGRYCVISPVLLGLYDLIV